MTGRLICLCAVNFSFIGIFSCSNLPWSDKAEEVSASQSKDTPTKKIAKPTPIENLELKYARLWSRLDELEEELAQQKELIELLERAQRTGILPSRLTERRKPSGKSYEKSKAAIESMAPKNDDDDFVAVEKQIADNSKKPSGSEEKSELRKNDNEEEKLRRLAIVQDLFRQGSYGQSMAEVNTLIKELGDTSDGLASLWVARNWLALKEFQLASENFQRFLKAFPRSSYLPRARLDMARSDLQRGLRNKANQEFQALIREFPSTEISEIAAMELERMQRSL